MTHASGEASDVPVQIRKLRSQERNVFDSAMEELFSTIWHQGTIYEASVHAQPFLIELLDDESIIDMDLLVLLIASIASGRGYHQVHSITDKVSPFTGEGAKKPEKLKILLSIEQTIVEKTRSVSENIIERLLPYLNHKEPDMRSTIAEVLSCYPHRKAKFLPILKEALKKEKDAEVSVKFVESIESLSCVQ